MKLEGKVHFIKKELCESNSDNKFEILNFLLSDQGITIVPINVNRKVIDEGIREHTSGAVNSDRYHSDIRRDFSYELQCEFVIKDDKEEMKFPSIISSHVSHSDLLKEAYETMLYILFGLNIK